MALLGDFLGPNSPKYYPILIKFSPEVLFKEKKKCVLRIFQKFNLLRKRGIPSVCTLGPTLTPRSSLKMTEIGKSKWLPRKTLAIGLSKYRNIKTLSPLAFPRKIRLLFALFWLFLAGNRPRSKVKRSEWKFEIAYFTKAVPGHVPVKKVWF